MVNLTWVEVAEVDRGVLGAGGGGDTVGTTTVEGIGGLGSSVSLESLAGDVEGWVRKTVERGTTGGIGPV